jgi:PcfJ-like protein
MTFHAAQAGNARAPVRARDFFRTCAMLKRFDAGLRPRVAELVAEHIYYEDLMWSFPAVLHALALARNGDVRADNARLLVTNGAALRMIAGALGIPFWTRPLQVEAFAGPLPVLPDSKSFEMRVANHIPENSKEARQWLHLVSAAYQACDENFALWVAKHPANFNKEQGEETAAILGLFAWYSARPLLEASQTIERPWKAEMSVQEVRASAERWIGALHVPLYGHVRDVRLAAANPERMVNGIEFVRLRTPDDLLEEGQAMNHCVATYVASMAKGCSLIHSLRENSARVATLEVRFPRAKFGRPISEQLRGPNNAEPPHHVWTAMHAWLAGWRDPATAELPCGCTMAPDRAVWMRLWKPYWMEKGLMHFLHLVPEHDALRPALYALWR